MTFPDTVDDKLIIDGAHIRSTQNYTLEAVNGKTLDFRGDVRINGVNVITEEELEEALPYVDGSQFGLVPDAPGHQTSQMQAFVNYLVTNHRQGWLSTGRYKINSRIITQSQGWGWGLCGETAWDTVIEQMTDNEPIFQLGHLLDNYGTHTITLRNLGFDYTNSQPHTNTNANPILFYSPIYFSTFDSLAFFRGSWAMRTAIGMVDGVWGNRYNHLTGTEGLTGGLMDWSSVTIGSPCNKFGRITIRCNNMVGPVFKGMLLLGSHFSALEFLESHQGPSLMDIQSGSSVTIGSISVENGTWTGAKALFTTGADSHVVIESFAMGGNNLHINLVGNAFFKIFANFGGGKDSLRVENLRATIEAPSTFSGNPPPFVIESSGYTSFGAVHLVGFVLTPVQWSISGDYITVDKWMNSRFTSSGDSNYTVTVGTANKVHFNTAFTAQRTITLPAKESDNLCNGLTYEFIFDGSIRGANTALIKEGANTLRTHTTDKSVVAYTWRRNSWHLTKNEELQLPSTVYPSGDVTGVTDLAAINAAIIANASVVLAPGTFYVNGTINLASNRKLSGSGKNVTTVFCVSGSNLAYGVISYPAGSLSNVTVSDMTIDANKAGNTGTHGLSFILFTNSTLERCRIKNTSACGISVYQGSNFTAIDNDFIDIGDANTTDGTHGAIVCNATVDVRISGNRIDGCTDSGITTYQGGLTTITGNEIQDCYYIGIALGGGNSPTGGPHAISGNTVKGCVASNSIDTGDACNVSVSGNTLIGGEAGICHDSSLQASTVANISYTGNTIYNPYGAGILIIGNQTTPHKNCVVSGNVINQSGGSGIAIDHFQGATVSGNTIRAVAAAQGFIQLFVVTDAVITGNVALDTAIASGVANLGSSNNWNVISHNNFRSCGTAISGTSGVNTTIIDNIGLHSGTVASAATITIPASAEFVNVTGTTGITSVTAGYAGQRVTLKFAAALTVTDGSNLKLTTNFVTTADDTLSLICDGTNWFETARAAN